MNKFTDKDLIGLVGLKDPLISSINDTLKTAEGVGIKVIFATAENKETTKHRLQSLGYLSNDKDLLDHEILNHDEFNKLVGKSRVETSNEEGKVG